jgi:CheY-like chemotaxis protein
MAKLMFVDDDPVILNLIARLLRRAGHTVVEANNGAECLARAAEERFEVIITDVMMPDMDGYGLTQALRAHPATRDTPILIVTANVRGPDRELSRAVGADGHDIKTVNIERLNDKIKAVLAARNASADASLPTVEYQEV